jgi:hypothetical protein
MRPPAAHADDAAEAIRALNHTTLYGGYAWPAEVYAVIGELHRMAQSLPQALAQAIAWLDTATAAGRIGHDHGTDPRPAVRTAIADLVQASIHAQHLAAALEQAHASTSHLNGEPTWT